MAEVVERYTQSEGDAQPFESAWPVRRRRRHLAQSNYAIAIAKIADLEAKLHCLSARLDIQIAQGSEHLDVAFGE